MVKNHFTKQGTQVDPGQGAKILHAMEQPSLHAATREFMHCSERSHGTQQRPPHAAAKAQCSLNKLINLKNALRNYSFSCCGTTIRGSTFS